MLSRNFTEGIILKLTLIRHGSTPWNAQGLVQGHADSPLNEEGIQQAERLAESLKTTILEYAAIYCSPLQRAYKTAEIVQNHSAVPLFPDNRLISRDLGLFSGKTLDTLKQTHPELYKLWVKGDESFCPPQGESTESLNRRTKDFLNFLWGKYKSTDKILIVAHRENIGSIMKVVGFKFSGDPLKAVDNCTPYYLDFFQQIS